MARILLVDDDADVRESVAEALRTADHDVVQAEDGERALDEIARSKPDVILLDVLMPRWSGHDFIHGLRRLGDGAICPIIVFTGGDRPRQVAAQLGTPYYLQKPCAVPQLLMAIEGALVGSRLPPRRNELQRTRTGSLRSATEPSASAKHKRTA
jgi:two-component system response regulator MprA